MRRVDDVRVGRVYERGHLSVSEKQQSARGYYYTKFGVVDVGWWKARDGFRVVCSFIHRERDYYLSREYRQPLTERGYLRVARRFAYDVVAGRYDAGARPSR